LEAEVRDPHHYEIYFNLGVCYDKTGQYDESIESYTKTLVYEPDHVDAIKNRGVVYSNHKNEQSKAIDDFKKVLEYAPKDPDGLMNLSVSYYKNNQYQDALEYANIAVEAHPNNGKSYYIRSAIYTALGQSSDAKADEEHAKRLGFISD